MRLRDRGSDSGMGVLVEAGVSRTAVLEMKVRDLGWERVQRWMQERVERTLVGLRVV